MKTLYLLLGELLAPSPEVVVIMGWYIAVAAPDEHLGQLSVDILHQGVKLEGS